MWARWVDRHVGGGKVDGQHVGVGVDTCDYGGPSGGEAVAFLPGEDEGFLGLFEDEGVDGVGAGLEEKMGGDDGTDSVDFLDGEGVERVVGGVGGVVAAARGIQAEEIGGKAVVGRVNWEMEESEKQSKGCG